VLGLLIEDHPHRARPDFRRKLVACLLAHGPTFSRVGASGKPGAVQTDLLRVSHAAECRAELVRQSPERGPPATEAPQYWTVLVVFAGKQEVVFLEHPS